MNGRRREQLLAAIGGLLGAAEQATYQAVILNDALVTNREEFGEHPRTDHPLIAPLFNDLTGPTTRTSAARFKIELLERRLRKPGYDVLGRCLDIGGAAAHNRADEVRRLRETQLQDIKALTEAYRELA